MEFIYNALELPFVDVIFVIVGIIAIIFGIIMIDGINRNKNVILISYLFRNKNLEDQSLSKKYKIQGYYTIIIGACLIINFIYIKLPGNIIFYVLITLAICDFFYDYFAIKTSKR